MKKVKLLLLPLLLSLITIGCAQNRADRPFLEERVEAKGYLYIEGGTYIGDMPEYMLQKFLSLVGDREKRVVVIPFAGRNLEEFAQKGDLFKNRVLELGAQSAHVIVCEKEEVDSPENLKLLESANIVFFTGGQQAKLADWMLNTKLLESVKRIYSQGGVVGGSSAGASIMGRLMPSGTVVGPDDPPNKLLQVAKGTITLGEGFGFLQNIIVHQHYLARKRTHRLFSALLDYPNLRGVGIDEKTAIIVKPNSTFEVIGESKVLVFEPYDLSLKAGGEGDSFIVRILSEGDSYNFK
ncbi:MAG: cyanophycinase [Bacteroidales bacterium]